MITKAQFGFVIEYVSDIDAAKTFFVDVLGLEVEREHPTFVQLKAQDGARYAIATDERMDAQQSGAPELWWLVDDIEAAFAEMAPRVEVSLTPLQKPFGTCFGIRDPAGQVHYVLAFAKQRPSRPVA